MLRRWLPCLVAALFLTLLAVVPGTAFAIDRDTGSGETPVAEEVAPQTLLVSDLSNATAASGGSCTAQLDCGDGNTVSCSGSTSCQTTIAGVKCDGQEVRCPNFCSVGVQCPCGLTICWSTSGNCTQFPPTCNGRELRCRCPFNP